MSGFRHWLPIVPLIAALFLAGCGEAPTASAPATQPKQAESITNIYSVKGVVQELNPDGRNVRIRHEEITNYMKAMTMEFEARNTNELRGLKPGDVVSFRMLVTDDDGWIDRIQKLGVPPAEVPSVSSVRRVKDVEPLEIGQVVPNYHFTNELGEAVNLDQFRGQALAIEFIFTSCPFPTFCPRLAKHFENTQHQLSNNGTVPGNWRLLSVTIDPTIDTPAVLKAYGERYNYNPEHWSFLTGDIIEITALADHFGQVFAREGGTINHNVRVAVIDPKGRVHQVLIGNEWKPEVLVEEITKALQVK
jgi:protein SCO1